MSGLFVVLEGIDGSGKTEQSRRLVNQLHGAALASVTPAAFPADYLPALKLADSQFGSWGAAARAWGITQASAEDADFALGCFVQDRYQLSFAVQEAVRAGKLVVCDRWEPSTWAYRLASGMATSAILRWIDRFPPVIQPDLTLWLRVAPEVAFQRARVHHRDLSLSFLRRVHEHYAVLPNLTPVDAALPLSEVTEALESEVRRFVAARALRRCAS